MMDDAGDAAEEADAAGVRAGDNATPDSASANVLGTRDNVDGGDPGAEDEERRGVVVAVVLVAAIAAAAPPVLFVASWIAAGGATGAASAVTCNESGVRPCSLLLLPCALEKELDRIPAAAAPLPLLGPHAELPSLAIPPQPASEKLPPPLPLLIVAFIAVATRTMSPAATTGEEIGDSCSAPICCCCCCCC